MSDLRDLLERGDLDGMARELARSGHFCDPQRLVVDVLHASIRSSPDMPIDGAKQALWSAFVNLTLLGDDGAAEWAHQCWGVLDEADPYKGISTRLRLPALMHVVEISGILEKAWGRMDTGTIQHER